MILMLPIYNSHLGLSIHLPMLCLFYCNKKIEWQKHTRESHLITTNIPPFCLDFHFNNYHCFILISKFMQEWKIDPLYTHQSSEKHTSMFFCVSLYLPFSVSAVFLCIYMFFYVFSVPFCLSICLTISLISWFSRKPKISNCQHLFNSLHSKSHANVSTSDYRFMNCPTIIFVYG